MKPHNHFSPLKIISRFSIRLCTLPRYREVSLSTHTHRPRSAVLGHSISLTAAVIYLSHLFFMYVDDRIVAGLVVRESTIKSDAERKSRFESRASLGFRGIRARWFFFLICVILLYLDMCIRLIYVVLKSHVFFINNFDW